MRSLSLWGKKKVRQTLLLIGFMNNGIKHRCRLWGIETTCQKYDLLVTQMLKSDISKNK